MPPPASTPLQILLLLGLAGAATAVTCWAALTPAGRAWAERVWEGDREGARRRKAVKKLRFLEARLKELAAQVEVRWEVVRLFVCVDVWMDWAGGDVGARARCMCVRQPSSARHSSRWHIESRHASTATVVFARVPKNQACGHRLEEVVAVGEGRKCGNGGEAFPEREEEEEGEQPRVSAYYHFDSRSVGPHLSHLSRCVASVDVGGRFGRV